MSKIETITRNSNGEEDYGIHGKEIAEMEDSKEIATVSGTEITVSTPMEMIAQAVSQGKSLEQISQLMDLQDRWEENEARKSYLAAFAEFKRKAPKLEKDKSVSFESNKGKTSYKHGSLGSITDALSKPLGDVGLSYTWATKQGDGGMVTVTCIIQHEGGHSRSTSLSSSPDSSGGKNNIQAVGSVVSYLERYTLLAALGMSTADMDDDGASSGAMERITEEQREELQDLINEKGADIVKFCKVFNIGSLTDLKLSDYGRAQTQLRARKKT